MQAAPQHPVSAGNTLTTLRCCLCDFIFDSHRRCSRALLLPHMNFFSSLGMTSSSEAFDHALMIRSELRLLPFCCLRLLCVS